MTTFPYLFSVPIELNCTSLFQGRTVVGLVIIMLVLVELGNFSFYLGISFLLSAKLTNAVVQILE